jgi:hypothetical protein
MPLPQAVSPRQSAMASTSPSQSRPQARRHWRRSAAEQRTQRTQRTQRMRQLVRHGPLLLPLCGICGRNSPNAPPYSPRFVRARPLKEVDWIQSMSQHTRAIRHTLGDCPADGDGAWGVMYAVVRL